MNVHYSKELLHAFVVGPAELKKLVELFQKRIGKVDISTNCADDLSREFKTLKDLIAYENAKPKEIQRISLRARSDDYSKSITIVFGKSPRLSSGISIDATGREDVISRLKEEILDIIGGMGPWYSVMHRVNFFYVFFISWLVLGTIRILSYISVLALESKWVTALSILSIPLLVLSFFSNRLRDVLFPPTVFTIGQGESRYKRKERFQWVVMIGFVVSLAASLVIPIITIIF